MATALALIAAVIFAVSTVLQQKGGLEAPPLSLRHPRSFVRLAGQGTWLVGMLLLLPGWLLQAAALDRGRVAVIEPIFTMTVVFVLPLGYWLTAQTVTWTQIGEACLVVIGLSLFVVFGDAAGGRNQAPNWQWFTAIAVIALLCGVLLPLGGKDRPALRAGAYGTVAGVLSGLAATITKPVVELLHGDGLGAVLGNWQVYVLLTAGALGVLLQQVALQTGRLAPAVATGSVANPLTGVLLGIIILQERLSPPAWHKVVALAALGVALAAAVAISLAKERERRVETTAAVAGEPAT